MIVVIKRLLVSLIVMSAALAYAEDFGPVSIELIPAMKGGAAEGEYQVFEFRMTNKSLEPVEIGLNLEVEHYKKSIYVSRRVLLPPSSVQNAKLYYPTTGNVVNHTLNLYINRQKMNHTLLDHIYRNRYGANLMSPSIPIADYAELRIFPQHAEPTTISLAQWGKDLRDYSGLRKIYLSSTDVLPPEVEKAIMQWVRLGGTLIIFVAPNAPWPKDIKDNGSGLVIEDHLWGRKAFCRPLTPTQLKEIEKEPEKYKSDDDPWANIGSGSSRPVKESAALGAAGTFMRNETGNYLGHGTAVAKEELLPKIVDVPLRRLFVVMLFFVFLIGPVNYFYLKKKRREPWILVTTPVISLVFCVLVILFITVNEGWYSRGNSYGVTFLNQASHQADTIAYVSLYAPIAPRGGFNFPPEDCLAFYDGSGTIRLDENTSQHYDSSLIMARVPLNYRVARSEARRERLRVLEENSAGLHIVNGLGGKLSALAVAGSDGKIYSSASAVEAGAKVTLKDSGNSSQVRDFPSAAVIDQVKKVPQDHNSYIMSIAGQLPPGYYAAMSETSLFFTVGTVPDEFTTKQLIIGTYQIGEGKDEN